MKFCDGDQRTPASQDLTHFTENYGMPTPARLPFPKTLLTTLNSKSLRASSPAPQSRCRAHRFTATRSPTGSRRPPFAAVSLQTGSIPPQTRSACEEGAPGPQKAPQTQGSHSRGTPRPSPGPAPPGPGAAPPQPAPHKRALPGRSPLPAPARLWNPSAPPRRLSRPAPAARPPHSRLSPGDEAVHGSRHLSGRAGK